jgi:Tfp pilus assembly major pilin PilA
MHTTHKKQKGITLISLILILGLIAFLTLLILKISPIYMNHSKVVHALETLKHRTDIEKKSKREVWLSLQKQFNMNYVYDVKKRNVKITSRNGYLKVQIVYHIKKLIFGNLSVWVDFDDSIQVGVK